MAKPIPVVVEGLGFTPVNLGPIEGRKIPVYLRGSSDTEPIGYLVSPKENFWQGDEQLSQSLDEKSLARALQIAYRSYPKGYRESTFP